MIDHEGEVPVYKQLAAILRAQIESGELPPGRALPSIRTLSQEHELSDGSVKKALGILRAEGLVRGVAGRGVFVVPRDA
jgi:GntR family transcriptional regulator